MPIALDRIDHIVVTAWDVDRTIDFYQRVLGMEPVTFAGGRRGLSLGGALGPMRSVYVRDPDGNLVEISNYDTPAAS